MTNLYAHSAPDHPDDCSKWEPLETHLNEVAEQAGQFAAAFGAKKWGELAGRWHDLGKYSREFKN
jgi:CRISPR-associated endonuclease/helicase Cas3